MFLVGYPRPPEPVLPQNGTNRPTLCWWAVKHPIKRSIDESSRCPHVHKLLAIKRVRRNTAPDTGPRRTENGISQSPVESGGRRVLCGISTYRAKSGIVYEAFKNIIAVCLAASWRRTPYMNIHLTLHCLLKAKLCHALCMPCAIDTWFVLSTYSPLLGL